jgi:hypothetical protein
VELVAYRYQEWVDTFARAKRSRPANRTARRALARWENEGGQV